MKNLNVSYVGAELQPSVSPSTNGGGWKKGCDMHVVASDATVMTQLTSGLSPLYSDTRRPYYSGGVSTGNHYPGYVTAATGGSGENGTVSAVITPRGQYESYLKYGYGFVRTVRHFLYFGQLLLDTVEAGLPTMGNTPVAVGSCLNKEAVLNVVDFLALCNQYGCKVFLVLLSVDSSSPHGMYGGALTNFDVPGSQTANQKGASQTYLNAITEFIQALDQYPEAHAAIAGIDLHNEAYGQITNAGSLNLPASTAKAWIRTLLYTAKAASKTFLYTVSAQSGLSDSNSNMLAATPANAQAAAAIYAGADYIDQHIYANMQGGNSALVSGLANLANLAVPWICGEAADNGSSSGVSVFDGNAPIQQQATEWLLANLATYGCQSVMTPAFGNLTTFVSSSGNVQSYTDSGMTSLFRYYAGLHVV